MSKEIIEEEWQSIFLNAGTEKGLGDLSMMISTVSDIIQSKTASAVEAREREIQEYARKMRKDVDEGMYCNNQDGEWKNGYDCAMYDILSIINPSKE